MSDPRIKRTRDKLGDALIELLRDQPFDAITVQHVLDKAQVGRSTFYAHFKDKQDLFVSDYEDFLESFARRAPDDGRVFLVRELFAHVHEERALWGKLEEAGLLADFLALAEACFARGIESRLAPDTPHRSMKARALSAALLALVRQWKGTPHELDDFFHTLV
jgi:AcrR family transcriptional regulator